jgi:dihydroorotase
MKSSWHDGRTILLKGGRVIDPAGGVDKTADLRVEGSRITVVGAGQSARADVVIDCRDKIVAPGLIDLHVHLREPGGEEEETIATGSGAAAAGGFTSVACMPNTNPPLDNEAAIEFVLRQASRSNCCHVWPIGAITKGRQGSELAEIGQMVRAGAVGFSDDGASVASAAVLLRAMQYASMFDKVIIEHCEDPGLVKGTAMNAGVTATRLGLPGAPSIAEDLIVQRDVTLAEYTGCRFHVAHVSTRHSTEVIRQVKQRGVKVTAEVCPHHLLLTEEACNTYDPMFKVSPPLRSKKDLQGCLEGVVDGTIECLATDHAPHAKEEKELEFLAAPPGMIGLETALAAFIKALIEPKLLTWSDMLRKMTINPARVIGIDRGTLAEGKMADIVVIDPAKRWTVDANTFRSRSRNCPYQGWDLTGKAVLTICDGRITHAEQGIGVQADIPVCV